MNLLLLPAQVEQYTLAAKDPRLEHVRGVLRMGPGDSFEVGAENGPRGRATITTADRDGVVLRLTWGEHPPPPPPIDLLVALPRPATVRKIVMDATTLGVRSVHFFPGGRSDPGYARSRIWSDGSWQEARRLGAEQAFTTWLPEVALHGSMEEALERLPVGELRHALDVYEATARLSVLPPSKAGGACLAFGAERGWNANDRKTLRAAGFTLCSMGDRVMRLETAVTVGLALTLARFGTL